MLAAVDLRVVLRRLRHAEQRIELRQQHAQRAAGAQRLDGGTRLRFAERALDLAPHALGHQRVDLARAGDLAHQGQRLVGDAEAQRREARGEARHAQDADRVLGERRRDMAQHAALEVGTPAVGVDEPSVGGARHGVDGEVAPREVLLQRDRRREVGGEAVVAGRDLALEARQRVLLVRLGMQEDREIAADGAEALRFEIGGRRAHHHPVPLAHRATEQLVAYRAADQIGLYARHGNRGGGGAGGRGSAAAVSGAGRSGRRRAARRA